MKFRSRHDAWGNLVKLLHWLTAIFILAAVAIILDAQRLDLSIDTEHRRLLFRAGIYQHEAFGILALAAVAVRMVWRLFDKRPDLPATMGRWEIVASSLTHGALYVLAVAACMLGWYQVSSNGGLVHVFGWTGLPTLTSKDEHIHEVVAFWHEWVSWIFVGLIAFHALAALKHHLIDRDRVLRSMLPFSR